jgi:predicted metal-dependent HD superfamily phosphohydrolase
MLTDTFLKLVSKYTPNHELANDLWLEIFTKYSESKRHYHNIGHLENLIADLMKVRSQITDLDTTLFAVFYHDIIYKATSGTNEEDSAKLAQKRLAEIGFPAEKITTCAQMILATKNHQLTENTDTNLFTDADLAILGQPRDDYQQYSENVRKEHSIYPDFIYNSGRKKALEHFLDMERIYKTDYFFQANEKAARSNIADEIAFLEN